MSRRIETEHRDMPDESADRMIADLAQYAGIRIAIAVDPDNPQALATTVDIDDRAPCFAAVAAGLRDIADEFDRRHRIDRRCI